MFDGVEDAIVELRPNGAYLTSPAATLMVAAMITVPST
jgi:hypothetical protein